jgi:murein DD-endopeptidase MepM/ murein hydrolase activator NlpD
LPIERSGNPIGSLNRTYQVRTGDTLNLIALRTGVDADSLRRLNGFASLNAALNAGASVDFACHRRRTAPAHARA